MAPPKKSPVAEGTQAKKTVKTVKSKGKRASGEKRRTRRR